MKKLMFAMAAVAAGAVFAEGEITSANVVGYQQIAVMEGFSAFTPTFKNVTEAEYALSDIQVVDGDNYIGMVSLQVMDDAGDYTDQFLYMGSEMGWFGEVDLPTLKPGQSLCVNNVAGETVSFQVSGEVGLKNQNEIPVGFYLWGNATPVDVSLGDIQVVDVSGEINDDVMGMVSYQSIDSEGTGDYTDTFVYMGSEMGWFGEVDLPTLKPGQCGCVNNVAEGTVYFKVPSPLE